MSDIQDPGPLRDEINRKVADLFEFNQRVAGVLRAQAKDFEAIGSFFSAQSARSYDIAADCVHLAILAAENTGDILVAEFGVSTLLGHDPEESDEDEDEDKNGD